MALTRPRFFLADLVAIIALAGLALTLVRSFGKPGIPVGIFVLIGLVVIAVAHVQSHARGACLRPVRAAIHSANQEGCAPCLLSMRSTSARSRPVPENSGFRQLRCLWRRLARRGSLPIPTVDICRLPHCLHPLDCLRIALSLGMMLFLVLFFVLLVARLLQASARSIPAPCERCGSIIPPSGTTGPLICPRCSLGHAPRTQAQNERTQARPHCFSPHSWCCYLPDSSCRTLSVPILVLTTGLHCLS